MLALARSTHPAPTVGVTLITVILAVGTGLETWRVALLGIVILANQISVGLSNDWLDAGRDRRSGRTDKPVASGDVPTSVVRGVAFGAAALSLALGALLGWPAAVANALFLSAGWTYNLGLKATPVSVLPYAVGFGALPFVVTLARPEPAFAAAWVVIASSLLGIAAHFANAIPDLDDDRATGVRGLPSILGARWSGIVVALGLAGASFALVLGPADGDAVPARVAGLILGLVLAAVCAALVIVRPASRVAFPLTIVAALVAVLLLVTSGSSILA